MQPGLYCGVDDSPVQSSRGVDWVRIRGVVGWLSFVCLALRRLVLAQWMAFAGEARDDQTVLMYRLTRCCAGTAIRGWMALIW